MSGRASWTLPRRWLCQDYGGFASLFASGNRTARFPSELANGGYVGWSTLEVCAARPQMHHELQSPFIDS